MNGIPLGKVSSYISTYDNKLLYRVSRQTKRSEIGITDNELPFDGYDIWNSYELSWLDERSKPEVRIAKIIYSAKSKFIVESKSLKLYLNSFNNTKFENELVVLETIRQDLSNLLETEIEIYLSSLSKNNNNTCNIEKQLLNSNSIDKQVFDDYSSITEPQHILASNPIYCDNYLCIDDLNIECGDVSFENRLSYLECYRSEALYKESLYSNLLKSNCLVTGQPDWATLMITYSGIKINHHGLLKYIISFRNHNEFHEQCVERIFVEIMEKCKPYKLDVYARYTRRGGIDINPWRSSNKKVLLDKLISNQRLIRQ